MAVLAASPSSAATAASTTPATIWRATPARTPPISAAAARTPWIMSQRTIMQIVATALSKRVLPRSAAIAPETHHDAESASTSAVQGRPA